MEGQTAYRTVGGPATAQITEKKSRFIADVVPVRDAAQAEEALARLTRQYWDAKHHCHAYVIGSGGTLTHSSDDGEPSGTAGAPILSVLTGAKLTDTLIVVTRYFGGVLLGTGGLVRAYSEAARKGLQAAEIVRMIPGRHLFVTMDYTFVTPLQRYLAAQEIDPGTPGYLERVHFDLLVAEDKIHELIRAVTELTSGQALIETGETDLKQERDVL